MTTPTSSAPISYQFPLRPELPCIYGPIEFREERNLYERIDSLLKTTDLESEYLKAAFAADSRDWTKSSQKSIDRFALYASIGLRCGIARCLTGLSIRGLTKRAADSTTLAWFLGTADIERVKSPSKSTVHRLGEQLNAATLRRFNELLVNAAISPPVFTVEGLLQLAGLETAATAENAYFDTTCLKALIHMPVDWVLLRDGVRTLTKATVLIRNAEIKVRMPQEPLEFLSDINSLCMRMAAQRRKPDSKKNRKAVLRLMKQVTKKVMKHAQSHRDLLEKHWSDTDMSEKEAGRIIGRIDGILAQLPTAIKQAHDRMIGGRFTPNEEKIFSLYDKDIDIIVRGKAGAEVEFGSKLWLGEIDSGLIIDYALLKENQSDSALLGPALERIKMQPGLMKAIENVYGDRGIHSAANEALLEAEGISSGLCPRQPAVLAERLIKEPALRAGLKRRGGTEARIAIFKNVICQGQLREKTHEERERAVGRAVLAHNLYVLSKLQMAEKNAKLKKTESKEKKKEEILPQAA